MNDMRYAVLNTVSFLFVLIACGCRAVENYTDAEKAALANQSRPGRASIAVRDAVTGQPVAECNYGAFKFSTDETGVDRRLPIMFCHDKSQPESQGGNHEFDLVPGWYRLQLCSRAYRDAWTPRFEILEGRTTFLTTEMKKANRIRVTVLEGDGSPCGTGTLLLRGPTVKTTLPIRDGVGETLFDEDSLRITVDPRFMPEYRYQAIDVSLDHGKLNEITLKIEKA